MDQDSNNDQQNNEDLNEQNQIENENNYESRTEEQLEEPEIQSEPEQEPESEPEFKPEPEPKQELELNKPQQTDNQLPNTDIKLIDKPKKSKTKLLIIITLVLVTLGILGFVFYTQYFNQPKPNVGTDKPAVAIIASEVALTEIAYDQTMGTNLAIKYPKTWTLTHESGDNQVSDMSLSYDYNTIVSPDGKTKVSLKAFDVTGLGTNCSIVDTNEQIEVLDEAEITNFNDAGFVAYIHEPISSDNTKTSFLQIGARRLDKIQDSTDCTDYDLGQYLLATKNPIVTLDITLEDYKQANISDIKKALKTDDYKIAKRIVQSLYIKDNPATIVSTTSTSEVKTVLIGKELNDSFTLSYPANWTIETNDKNPVDGWGGEVIENIKIYNPKRDISVEYVSIFDGSSGYACSNDVENQLYSSFDSTKITNYPELTYYESIINYKDHGYFYNSYLSDVVFSKTTKDNFCSLAGVNIIKRNNISEGEYPSKVAWTAKIKSSKYMDGSDEEKAYALNNSEMNDFLNSDDFKTAKAILLSANKVE